MDSIGGVKFLSVTWTLHKYLLTYLPTTSIQPLISFTLEMRTVLELYQVMGN